MKNENLKSLLPALEPVEDILYLTGNPKNYQFHAGSGTFKTGNDFLTKPGESLRMIVTGYRIMEGVNLFGMKTQDGEPVYKDWAEFFFVNGDGAMSVLMFHGFSVDNFRNFFAQELFYRRLPINSAIIELTPKEEKNEKGDKYYILHFSIAGKVEFDFEAPAVYRQDTKELPSVSAENYPAVLLSGPKEE